MRSNLHNSNVEGIVGGKSAQRPDAAQAPARCMARSGILSGRCALVVVLILTATRAALASSGDTAADVVKAAPPGGLLEAFLFYLVGGSAVIAALGVCISTNIVRMAVWLFVALGSVAMLYFLLAASFLGAIQLIVYAGGTLILLIFGVMLTSKSPWARFTPSKGELVAATVVCGGLLSALCFVITRAGFTLVHEGLPGTAIADIGRALLTRYIVPFEVAGVVLMIVMVGAAHLARQEQ